MKKLSVAFSLLRNSDRFEKVGGVLSGAANVVRAADKAGVAASKFLAGKGHKNLALAARYTPHAVGVLGAKKAWESETAQNLRRKYQEHKMRKAMERAQRGY
jgi:hypothetical protein